MVRQFEVKRKRRSKRIREPQVICVDDLQRNVDEVLCSRTWSLRKGRSRNCGDEKSTWLLMRPQVPPHLEDLFHNLSDIARSRWKTRKC